MGCLEHIVPKYSLPNGEFEGRVVKTTTKITCVDFDHKGECVAVASEYAPIASSLACVKASGRCIETMLWLRRGSLGHGVHKKFPSDVAQGAADIRD
jgi:hypothetical protein